MTVFSQTWNASFEAIPANGDDASEGALRIRNLKREIQERGEVDHSWAGDVEDGTHKKVTFTDPLTAKPTQELDNTYLYTKDVAGTSELFFEDESGNEVQLTAGGSPFAGYPHVSNDEILIRPDATAGVATGWSTEAITNKALRLNSSAVHSTSDGGTGSFTSRLVDAHATIIANENSHTHADSFSIAGFSTAETAAAGGAQFVVDHSNHTHTLNGAVGAGANHRHSITIGVQYTDFRIVSKD